MIICIRASWRALSDGGHRINQISGFATTHSVYICLFWLLNIRIKNCCAWALKVCDHSSCVCLSCRNTLLPVHAPRCSVVMRFVFTHSRSVKLQGSEAAPRGPHQSILCARAPLYTMTACSLALVLFCVVFFWFFLAWAEHLLICVWCHQVDLSAWHKRLKAL